MVKRENFWDGRLQIMFGWFFGILGGRRERGSRKALFELGMVAASGLVKQEWIHQKMMTFHRFEEKLVVFGRTEKDSDSSTIRPQGELAL